MKRWNILVFVLIFSLILQIPVSGTPAASSASEAVSTLTALGILPETLANAPEADLTREAYVSLMLFLSGQEEKAELYDNNTLFTDIPTSHSLNGAIGAAVVQGYITGLPDGKFHPESSVTWSQLAVGIVKVLGYSESDIVGSWPYNYLNKLKSLELTEGISVAPQGTVSNSELAVILYRMLETTMKGGTQLFMDKLGNLKNIVVIENGSLKTDLDPLRVLTQDEVCYIQEGMAYPRLGYSYLARMEDGVINALVAKDYTYENYTVKDQSKGFILYDKNKSFKLPENISYYYGQKVLNAEEVSEVLQANSAIILAFGEGKAVYGMVYDPQYSSAKVISQSMTTEMLERLYSGRVIDRGGMNIRPSELEENNVVYEVTDIWGNNGFVLAYEEEVTGEVTAVLPNIFAPTSVEIDGVSYGLDASFPKHKINAEGNIEKSQTVTLLLGENGKAVDILLGASGENDEFALVVDAYQETSEKSEDYGQTLYFVNLLHTDGTVKTWLAEADMIALKGDLVTWEMIEAGDKYDTVKLTGLEYVQDKTHEIRIDERMLDNSYVTENVIIFNIVHNVYGRNSDAEVLKWSDLPSGRISVGKLKYARTTGDFQDIDVLCFDNVLDEGIEFGLVTDYKTTSTRESTTQTIKLLVGGKETSFTTEPVIGLATGCILRLRTLNGNILSAVKVENPYVSTEAIQAADSSRIRVKDTTLTYHRDLAVYRLTTGNEWVRTGINALTKENTSALKIYLDKPPEYGGKAVVVLIP